MFLSLALFSTLVLVWGSGHISFAGSGSKAKSFFFIYLFIFLALVSESGYISLVLGSRLKYFFHWL